VIKLDQIKNNKYQTNIYYKNTIVHTCKKTIEAYFNHLVFTNLESYPEFDYLFYNDDGFFDDNKVQIDTMETNSKSNERFDMKIYFENIDKSFALECFEKHHMDKFDSDNRFEISRMLNKNYCEKDVRFIVVFWYGDILNTKKFHTLSNKKGLFYLDGKYFGSKIYNSHYRFCFEKKKSELEKIINLMNKYSIY
jgi:hypothetical protein